MNERIERLREELERAKKRKVEADQRVKNCETRLREAENNQFISDMRKLDLRPEEVSRILQKALEEKKLEAAASIFATEVTTKDTYEDEESEVLEDEEI
ncbi:MAG: DUF4315 family protein [Butyrivibrio sp.]|nr:DUF4315 family protein [Butyrivibrio sp.]